MGNDKGKMGRTRSQYRHRFKTLTDWLVSPYNLGFCIYNWGFQALGGRKHEAFRQHIIELAELKDSPIVLDVGCGTGLTALRIADQHPGCKVYGIDLSPKMVEVARKDAVDRALDVNLCVGSITDLPYPDESFDVVLTNILFHHLDLAEKRQAVAEIARVLRSPEAAVGRGGGRYVSAEFGPRVRNPMERHLAKGEYTLYPSHLAEAGLSVRHEELSPFVWGLKIYYRVAIK
jgi:ubiquinone/menaquinone biosynthesis C-methylase UbiE